MATDQVCPAPDLTQKLQCTSCGLEGPCDDFHRNAAKKSGRESHCKTCVSLRKKATKVKKRADLELKGKMRLNTRVLNVNDLMIEETYAETSSADRNQIELLLKSLILNPGG